MKTPSVKSSPAKTSPAQVLKQATNDLLAKNVERAKSNAAIRQISLDNCYKVDALMQKLMRLYGAEKLPLDILPKSYRGRKFTNPAFAIIRISQAAGQLLAQAKQDLEFADGNVIALSEIQPVK